MSFSTCAEPGGNAATLINAYRNRKASFISCIRKLRAEVIRDAYARDSGNAVDGLNSPTGTTQETPVECSTEEWKYILSVFDTTQDLGTISLLLAICRTVIFKSTPNRASLDSLVLISLAQVTVKHLTILRNSFENHRITSAEAVVLEGLTELLLRLTALTLANDSTSSGESEHTAKKYHTTATLRKLGPTLLDHSCITLRLFLNDANLTAYRHSIVLLLKNLSAVLFIPTLSGPQLQRCPAVPSLLWDYIVHFDGVNSDHEAARLALCRYAALVPSSWLEFVKRACAEITETTKLSEVSSSNSVTGSLASRRCCRLLILLRDLLRFFGGSASITKGFGEVPLGTQYVCGTVPVSDILSVIQLIFRRVVTQCVSVGKAKQENASSPGEALSVPSSWTLTGAEMALIAEEDMLDPASEVLSQLVDLVPSGDLLIRGAHLRDILGLFLIPSEADEAEQLARTGVLLRYHYVFLSLVRLFAVHFQGGFLLDSKQITVLLDSLLFCLAIHMPGADSFSQESLIQRSSLASVLLLSRSRTSSAFSGSSVTQGKGSSPIFLLPPAPVSLIDSLAIIMKHFHCHISSRLRAKMDELAIRLMYLIGHEDPSHSLDSSSPSVELLSGAFSQSLRRLLKDERFVAAVVNMMENSLQQSIFSTVNQSALAVVEQLYSRLQTRRIYLSNSPSSGTAPLIERLPALANRLRSQLLRKVDAPKTADFSTTTTIKKNSVPDSSQQTTEDMKAGAGVLAVHAMNSKTEETDEALPHSDPEIAVDIHHTFAETNDLPPDMTDGGSIIKSLVSEKEDVPATHDIDHKTSLADDFPLDHSTDLAAESVEGDSSRLTESVGGDSSRLAEPVGGDSSRPAEPVDSDSSRPAEPVEGDTAIAVTAESTELMYTATPLRMCSDSENTNESSDEEAHSLRLLQHYDDDNLDSNMQVTKLDDFESDSEADDSDGGDRGDVYRGVPSDVDRGHVDQDDDVDPDDGDGSPESVQASSPIDIEETDDDLLDRLL